MKILVLNSGSSSLKYKVFKMPETKILCEGLIEKIGNKNSFPDHKTALQEVFYKITNGETAVLKDITEIKAVGHRVVHGGEKFSESVLITPKILEEIEGISDLAPLHNPANLGGIYACEELMGKDTPQTAVFDTSYHQSMQPAYYLYPIPYKYYTKYKIRKYGFHGTSHRYVAQRAIDLTKKDIQNQKIITCHLGNGASLCAIKDGKVIDTSMGFTPLAGLMMGTRSGDIDPSILEFLCKKENLSIQDVTTILNKKSGLLGISGSSNDMRDIEYGDTQSQLALDMYINRIIHYIGAYIATMGGLDILVFTAGTGERGSLIREKIIKRLNYLDLHIEKTENEKKGKEVIISTPESSIIAVAIPTQEELMIAKETYEIINNLDI